ncbi:FadR family transcriptional regulator [Egibacter rhizosphaerae]|uniref:FadR family transcriptional regulator n=1 Tax=Egibacter rhizosphaerae TaxID=1670831 RepID=A0A411YB99_9ACTN|nr:FadR/GntR family transcriptional regulator [Egibacter rhizosphaerae]QBI18533.1 FadR family transcriptional regulator [Egibacter rhizosphaerae]
MQEPSSELHLRPVERRRAYQEVVAQIQQEILAGRLRSGDRLPGERQLSEMLGVSRSSVREALRVLETLDIVRARTGTGPESGSIIVGEAGGTMGGVLLMHAALDHFSLEDVVNVRVALEGQAVRAAAQLRDDEQLASLEKLVHRMESGDLGPEEFLELDSSFHVVIAQASGNRLTGYVMQSLRQLIEHWLGQLLLPHPGWPELRTALASEHREVFEAIRDGDGERGAEILTEHIRKAYERVKR